MSVAMSRASCEPKLRTMMAGFRASCRGSGAMGICEGYSSLRHLGFGAVRYRSPWKDVLGQIHACRRPVLADKGRREQLA